MERLVQPGVHRTPVGKQQVDDHEGDELRNRNGDNEASPPETFSFDSFFIDQQRKNDAANVVGERREDGPNDGPQEQRAEGLDEVASDRAHPKDVSPRAHIPIEGVILYGGVPTGEGDGDGEEQRNNAGKNGTNGRNRENRGRELLIGVLFHLLFEGKGLAMVGKIANQSDIGSGLFAHFRE